MPKANHPIWPIIRYAVVGTVMVIVCSTLYKNGFDKKDIVLIATTLLSWAGVQKLTPHTNQKTAT